MREIPLLMRKAYLMAATSPDPSNQNGAVVIGASGREHLGYNGFGRLPWTQEMLDDRDQKLAFIEHAERAAIYECASWEAVTGATMVCPWACCTDCGRAIGRSGIKRLIVHRKRMETTPERWVQSVKDGIMMAELYGTKVEYYEGPLDCGFSIRANGEYWSPDE